MQLKPGDIVACTWSDMWEDQRVGRSRFIVLDIFDSSEDWFLDLAAEGYIKAYCYDFEGCADAVGSIFNLPGEYVVKIG